MGLIKTESEIQNIKSAGKILAQTAKLLATSAKEGVSLKSLDNLAHQTIINLGGKPSFLGYRPHGAVRPYPATICASINYVIVHGVPNNYILKSGDLLKIDIGVAYNGYNADAAFTIGIGKISSMAKKLIKTTKKALEIAVKTARPENTLGDVGYEINRYVTKKGFKTVEGLSGHGIGKEFHEEPLVMNFGTKGQGMKLLPGMVLAIEPMTSSGSSKIVYLPDESYATADRSLSAHFEHTVLISKKGAAEILTDFRQ